MIILWTLIGIISLGLLMKYLSRKRPNLPPGPKGIPFFGNVFQMDKSFPHFTLTEWSHQYGDVFLIKVGININKM